MEDFSAMNLSLGLLKIPKNNTNRESTNQWKTESGGAKRFALRPPAAALCNLIHRAKMGSML